MNGVSGFLHTVPPPAVYAAVAGLVLAESILLVGAFIPTLTVLLTAGVLARGGELNLVLTVAVAAASVFAGDALGHTTGRFMGTRLRTGRLGRHVPEAAWRRAQCLMDRRCGQAVALCRFVPVLRTLLPHLAGATGVPYRRIAPYSALAALVWAGLEVSAGYLATASAQRLITIAGPALVGAIVLSVVVGYALARKRRTPAPPAAPRSPAAFG
ncbi:DedA family protein [Streptomyces sp. NPDC058623]|uniref:DedA family protein n=1 Tax=Streptomyces sp. NPDC058623 TaxID=3346563 RepID=UPI00364708F3